MTTRCPKILLGTAFLLTALAFLLTAAIPRAHAQGAARFVIGDRYWYLEDQPQAMDVAPVIINSRTYLPVRYLAQALGIDQHEISWQPQNGTVTMVSGGTTVSLTIGSATMLVNDSPQALDVAPLLVPPGRVILPARRVAQAFGWQVDWQAATRTVAVYPREVTVARAYVNVRKGPGLTAPVLTTLAPGTRLSVTGQADTWLAVSLPGGVTGWLAGFLVTAIAPPTPISRNRSTPAAPVATPAQETGPAPTGPTATPPTSQVPAAGGEPLVRVPLAQGLSRTSFSLNATGQLLDADTNRLLATLAPAENYQVTAAPNGLVLSGVTLSTPTRDFLIQAVSPDAGDPFLVSLQDGSSPSRYRSALVIRLDGPGMDVYNQLPLEEYLYGVVPREMSPSAPPAALAAQAIAARTYALAHLTPVPGRVCSSLSPEDSCTYGGYDAEYPATDEAVDLTRGLVLMADGQPADAVYFASDGGYTENSEDVWNAVVPYLRGKPDPYDPTGQTGRWQVTQTAAQLCRELTAAGHPFAAISDIRPSAYTAVGHRIKVLTVTGLTPAGQQIAMDIGNADNVRLLLGLPSSPFTLVPVFTPPAPGSPVLSAVTFTGAGEGHDVGLSQEGAEGMAASGHNYQEILDFYYTGLSLVPDYGR